MFFTKPTDHAIPFFQQMRSVTLTFLYFERLLLLMHDVYHQASLSIRCFWDKRGKMEVKKGESWRRETPDTDAFSGAFHPHTAWFDTIQSKSLPVIGLSASRAKKLA